MDFLRGVREYVYPVGRLDYDSEGLVLLTNDGELAALLMHPRHDVPRTYEARLVGIPDDDALERLRRGIPLDGRRTRPAEVALLNRRTATSRTDALLRITIREGRNRQVRRMCDAIGHPVRSLARVRIGSIADPRLRPGDWRELTPAEVHALRRSAAAGGTDNPTRARTPRARGHGA